MQSSYSFLVIGKTHESVEAPEFKKYIGVGSSYVLAVNPTKDELEKITGYEIANPPQYTNENDEVPNIRIDFVVKTDPEACKDAKGEGIEAINHITFFLKNRQAISQNGEWCTVIDKFGNSTLCAYEDAKMNKALTTKAGMPAKIAPNYRIALEGEAELVAFLKTYLGVEDAFDYTDSTGWTLKSNPDEYAFVLEHINDYFKGDVSEIRDALNMQPNNKIKLLYGIRNSEKGQFQTISTDQQLMVSNRASNSTFSRMEKRLEYLMQRESFAAKNIFEICPLKEYTMEPTNLSAPIVEEEDNSAPWD